MRGHRTAWRILLNFPERAIYASNVFSMLGPWFFLLGLIWGHSSPWSDSLSSVPLSFSSIRRAHRGERSRRHLSRIWIWIYCLSFQRKALFRVASSDFPQWLNMIEISTTYLWHPVSCSSLLKFSITNKQKCWHVDYCHWLTAWFRSWSVSQTPTSRCIQQPPGAWLWSDLLLW